MYRLLDTMTVQRIGDGTCIPVDSGNADYRNFLAWRALGNVPEPAPAPDPKAAIRAAIDTIEHATGVVRVVREALMTFAELEATRQAALLAAQGTVVTATDLLAQNAGYVRTKAVDDQIAQLRGMLA